jgi:citrate synthase
LNSAIAAGVLAISRFHGGAIEEGMRLFIEIAERMREKKQREEEVARKILLEMKQQKKRASGFGHRLHTLDPRTEKLFSLAEELGLAGKHVGIARAVEKNLKEIQGRSLPINVDGAIAALLCDLGFDPEVGNAFFIIARVVGLTAHIQEEKSRMKPMRKIHPEDFEYDGPQERKI